jgi:hypothetical protein
MSRVNTMRSFGDRLHEVLEDADVRALAPTYLSDARLEALLPGARISREGRTALIDELTYWWGTPGQLLSWSEAPASDGLIVTAERRAGAGSDARLTRLRHFIHLVDGRARRHLILSERPQIGRPSGPIDPTCAAVDLIMGSRVAGSRGEPAGVLSPVLRTCAPRDPLAHGGMSGSSLDLLVQPDGSHFVLKHLTRRSDWIMRATADEGREASLWLSGALQSVDDVIDYPVVAAGQEEDGWVLVMRDVSAVLTRPAATISRQQSRRLL